jgi:hypothetical protein
MITFSSEAPKAASHWLSESGLLALQPRSESHCFTKQRYLETYAHHPRCQCGLRRPAIIRFDIGYSLLWDRSNPMEMLSLVYRWVDNKSKSLVGSGRFSAFGHRGLRVLNLAILLIVAIDHPSRPSSYFFSNCLNVRPELPVFIRVLIFYYRHLPALPILEKSLVALATTQVV